jgi:hypothetical protein
MHCVICVLGVNPAATQTAIQILPRPVLQALFLVTILFNSLLFKTIVVL